MEVIKIKGNYKRSPLHLKLKVAAYVRVSTINEKQLGSFESQKRYYENKITTNENWNFVGIYSDYGISGTSVSFRTDFKRMIEDCNKGKIDLILTKSISRFARNTVDTLKYVRELKAKNIGIYFEEEGIYSLYNSTELLLTVLSSVAQQEIETLSSHVKLGKEMLMERGISSNGIKIYGYDYNPKNKMYSINKYESRIVRRIFNKYLKCHSTIETTIYLNKKKYLNYKREPTWDQSRVARILRNKRYIGILEMKKNINKHVASRQTKVNNGEENRYIVYDFNKRIIDEDTFYEVQRILDSNTKVKRNKKVCTNEIICGFCGFSLGVYNRNTNNELLMCHLTKNCNEKYCKESKSIKVSTIKEVLIECLTKYLKSKGGKIICNEQDKLSSLYKEKEIVLRKKSINIEQLFEKKINKSTFYKTSNYIDEIIDDINTKIKYYEDYKNAEIERKNNEDEFYDSLVEKLDIKLSLYELLEKLNFILMIGGYDESNHKKPYMIRFVLVNNKRKLGLRQRAPYYKSLTINNYNSFKYHILLDYKSKYKKRVAKKFKDGIRIINKKIRVRLEIVEERYE